MFFDKFSSRLSIRLRKIIEFKQFNNKFFKIVDLEINGIKIFKLKD